MTLLNIIDSLIIVPKEVNGWSGVVKIIKVNHPEKGSMWAVTNGDGSFLLSKEILEFEYRPASTDGKQAWDDFRNDCYFSSVVDALNEFKKYIESPEIIRNQMRKHYTENFKYEELLQILKVL